MKGFQNLKIGTRMIIGFLAIALIAGIIGVIGIVNLQNTSSDYSISYSSTTTALKWLEELSSNFQRSRMNLYGIVLAPTQKDKEFYIDRVEQRCGTVLNAIAEYKKLLEGYDHKDAAQEAQLLQAIEDKLNTYITERDRFIKDYAMDVALQQTAYEQLGDNGSLRNLGLAADAAVQDLIDYNLNFAENLNKEKYNQTNTITWISAALVLGGMVVAVLIGLFTARGISKPVNSLIVVADKLALGDVDQNVQSTSRDEIGKLMDAFNNMIENIRMQCHTLENVANGDFTVNISIRSETDLMGRTLTDLVRKLKETLSGISSSADQIATGSKQIADSGISISQGATEQASSVEELTATITEIATGTQKNAANTKKLLELAGTIESNADTGSQQMQEMLKAMVDINESSGNISKIIKVIDDIAFQTNILALNAAVEAARAGQYGKGFAVVAEEVRTLASRSADAAKETTELIEGSIRKVQGGSAIANNTADALKKIVSGVEAAGKLVSEITSATDEQATATRQVSEGIFQISQVVQANSATSEETAALSEELSSQAASLKDMVGQFKLK